MQKYNLKFNKKLEKQAGITLVALVITVVIMLILAGVAIAAVVDGDGLFSKTRQAANEYNEATVEENQLLKDMLDQIDIYLNELDNNPVVKPEITIGTIVNENQTYDGRLKGTYSNPIIPKGFAPINENGADWGTEEGYKSGLVITDEVDIEGNSIGNEFVWVPVDRKIVKFERYDFGKNISSINFNNIKETIPTEIISSVNNNGGFYIARYEAGIAENMVQQSLSEDSTTIYGGGDYRPLSKQGIIVWNYIQWGANDYDIEPGNGAVTVARSMYPEDSEDYGVASTLIYGIQWDTALKFIEAYDIGETGYDNYATDSTGMGNYSGTNGTDDIVSTSEPAECGAREGFRQKNIYDMAGNVWELTMEARNTYRVDRGGDYSYSGLDFPAAYRSNGGYDLTGSYIGIGFRVALYIK